MQNVEKLRQARNFGEKLRVDNFLDFENFEENFINYEENFGKFEEDFENFENILEILKEISEILKKISEIKIESSEFYLLPEDYSWHPKKILTLESKTSGQQPKTSASMLACSQTFCSPGENFVIQKIFYIFISLRILLGNVKVNIFEVKLLSTIRLIF